MTRTQANSLRRFTSKDVVNAETGEILDSRKLLALLDERKLEDYTGLMGYYQIRTSEVEMDDRISYDPSDTKEISDKKSARSQRPNDMDLQDVGSEDTESTAEMESDPNGK